MAKLTGAVKPCLASDVSVIFPCCMSLFTASAMTQALSMVAIVLSSFMTGVFFS